MEHEGRSSMTDKRETKSIDAQTPSGGQSNPQVPLSDASRDWGVAIRVLEADKPLVPNEAYILRNSGNLAMNLTAKTGTCSRHVSLSPEPQ